MSLLNVNGKLTRIDTPAASVSGDVTYTNGATLDVDATIDQPTGQQRYQLGAAIADATAVIYVLTADLPAGQAIPAGSQVVANQTGLAAVTYRVIRSDVFVFDELSHLVLYCKVA